MNYQQMPISNLWRNKNDESKQFVCKDCGNKNYQLFMANDNLWQKYGTGNNTLCQKCFEKKLGRKMTQKDTEQYKHSPINSHIVNFKEWLLNESKFPVLPNKIGKHNEYELQNFEPKLEEIIEKIKQKLNQEPTSTSELIYQFDTYELSNRKKYILKPIARIFLTKEIPGEAQGGFEEDRNIVWVSRIIKPYQIKKVLLHELGHLFDPKMRVPEYMEKSRLKQQTNPESQFYKQH